MNLARFITLLLLIISTTVYGYKQHYTGRVSSSDIQNGIIIEDQQYNNMLNQGSWSTDYYNESAKGIVKFGVDHSWNGYMSQGYDLEYSIDIKWYDENGNDYLIEDVCMNVSYDPTAATNYNDQATYVVDGAHKVQVIINEIYEYNSSSPCSGTVVTTHPENLYLEGSISVERHYLSFDETATWNNTLGSTLLDEDNDSKNDFIELNWGYVEGAEFYDVEWTHINDYKKDGTTRSTSDIVFTERDFELNSTRISTTDQTYKIPMVFDRGYVVYRVRAVSKGGPLDGSDPTFGYWVFGKWSTDGNMVASNGKLSDFPDMIQITSSDAHDDDKNWQHVATYAEDGKRKDVVTYYDGSMRSRQMVTRINSDDHVVVGQTLYDYQGREAVNILPVPQHESVLKYREQFNKDDQGNELTKDDFDLDNQDPCEPQVLQLSLLDGAGEYYSSNNPNQEQWQAYVPDANGYAYTQVEYTPDNTGRVRRQTGVGEDHMLESGHETQYFYGQPAQEELDILFGANVGYNRHYKKNMVVDANGQVSVSYVDAHGRTIATSFAGDGISNLENLEDENDVDQTTLNGQTITSNLLGNGNFTNNYVNSDGTSLDYNGEILVSTQGTNDFAYNVEIPAYSDPCLTVDLPVVVDLELGAYNDCGEVVFNYPGGNGNLSEELGTYSLTGGGTLTASYDQNDGLTNTLGIGNYTVYKTLSINDQALQDYAENYISLLDPQCLVELDEFVSYQDSLLNDLIDCAVTCESCVSALDDYFLNAPEYGSIPTSEQDPGYDEYMQAYDDCMLPCEGKSYCETMKEMMLLDVSPNGQYGKYDLTDFSTAAFPLSVFNTSNSLVAGQDYTDLQYYEADGSQSYVFIDPLNPIAYSGSTVTINGDEYVEPQQITNLEDFIANWKPSWANSLLSLHPEYCYLSYCDDLSTPNHQLGSADVSSEEFDEILLSLETFSEASSVDINGTNYDLTDLLSGSSSVLYDPYFNGIAGATYETMMVDQLTNYANSMSMTDFAAYTVDCANFYGTNTGNCTYTYSNNDAAWNTYRSYYLAAKQEIQDLERQQDAITNGCFNGCIGASDMSFANTDNFWNSLFSSSGFFDITAPFDQCSYNNFLLFSNKTMRFASPGSQFNLTGNDQDDVDQLEAQADYEYFQQTGLCPNAVDIQNVLLELVQDDALLTTNNPILNYASFTQDLYDALTDNDNNFSTDYYEYEIEPSTSAGVLTIGFEESSNLSSCELTLTLPGSSTLSWSNHGSTWSIDYFSNMNVLTTSTFTIEATLEDGTSLTLDGTSGCFDLNGCGSTFDQWLSEQCQPNIIAQELSNLMSLLIASGDLSGTSVNISQAPFEDVIENIDAIYGGTWEWNASGTTYTLGNGTETFEIDVQGTGFSPDFITEIMPNDQNPPNGIIHWVDSNGDDQENNVDITLDSSTIPLGECGVTEDSYACSESPQQNREGLQTLLSEVFASNITNQDPLSYYGYFTNSLQQEFGSSSFYNLSGINLSSASNTISIVNGPADTTFCTIEMDIVSNWQNFQFSDIDHIEGLYALDGPGQLDANGNAYDFVIHAQTSTGDNIIIEGSSCFPLANCNNCYDCGESPYSSAVLARLYNEYVRILDEIGESSATLSLQEFSNYANNPSCFDSYQDYLADLDENGISTAPFENIDDYCPAIGCDFDFSDYETIVDNDPRSPYHISEEEFSSVHTLCMDEYLDYYAVTGSPMTLEEFCGDFAPIPQCKPYDNGPFDLPDPDDIDECEYFLDSLIDYQANQNYDQYIDGLINTFIEDYKEHVMTQAIDTLTRTYHHNEYQYTLYYYDQAGNLVQTVPPKGVDFVDANDLPAVASERDANTKTTLPSHTYKTQYHYNSLNQLIEQTTPDTDGPSEFFYDALGRLVVSQNAKQANYTDDAYSYTLYDELGRVVEVGQISDVSTMTQTIAGETGPFEAGHSLFDWLNNGVINTLPTKTEVTQTHYDMALPDPAVQNAFESIEIPSNWRNRIASITYHRDYDWNANNYDNALHYRYDIHGNVSQLVQEIKFLTNQARRFVRTDYAYDLISGNVLQVAFQAGKVDAFYHHYYYDADNRITHALTSTDRVHWDRDAKYFYYEHGPLARTEIGHNKVQANDYAYTIQGWIKGVNSASLYSSRDQGKDAHLQAIGNANKFIAHDETGYTLGYFQVDYASIGNHSTTEHFEMDYSGNTNFTSRNLYNGNIAHMVTAINSLNANATQAMVYDYDQLNRIKSAQSLDGENIANNNFSGATLSQDYATAYEYDLNGNLYELSRNGNDSGNQEMDLLTYEYFSGTNKLAKVKDTEDSGNGYAEAIGYNTSGWEYDYDEIGQLTYDEEAEIASIEWTVNNKVYKITREAGSDKDDLEFIYDPLGNRIGKIVKPRSGGNPSPAEDWIYKYYQRDAQGNTMAIYELNDPSDPEGLTLLEQNIYGSSRLGTINRDIVIPLMEQGCREDPSEPVGPTGPVYPGPVFPGPVVPVGPWPSTPAEPVGNIYTKGYIILQDDPGSVIIEANSVDLNKGLKGSDYPNISTFAQFLVSLINSDSHSTGWKARQITNDADSMIIEISETIPQGKSLNLVYQIGGVSQPSNVVDLGIANCTQLYTHTLGNKNYELSNHLGNVLTTVSDMKVPEELTNVVLMDNTFDDAGDTEGWYTGGNHYSIESVGGKLEMTTDINNDWGVNKYISTEIGKTYTVTFDVDYCGGSAFSVALNAKDEINGTWYTSYTTSTAGSHTWAFTATSAFTRVKFSSNYNPGTGNFITACFDNIKITSDEEVIYHADVTSYSDYYPFGMQMPGRNGSIGDYRYGFQGQEKDDEVKGEGNSINYKFRIHDPRIGRFFAVDPLTKDFPHNSPYAFSENSTIAFIELEGLERYYAADGTYLGQYKDYTDIRIVDEDLVDEARKQLRIHSQNPDEYNGYLGAFIPDVGSQSIDDYAESVEDVLNDAELETYADNNHNCNDAARAQMSKNNTQTNGSANVIQTDVNNEIQAQKNKGNLTENKIGGAIYVMTQLKNNNPVMVGVRETTSTSNYVYAKNINALTGHFIVISSMHISEDGSISFGYYDNANSITGKSDGNRLELNTSSGSMTDGTNVPVGGVESYEVSEVRTNVETESP